MTLGLRMSGLGRREALHAGGTVWEGALFRAFGTVWRRGQQWGLRYVSYILRCAVPSRALLCCVWLGSTNVVPHNEYGNGLGNEKGRY